MANINDFKTKLAGGGARKSTNVWLGLRPLPRRSDAVAADCCCEQNVTDFALWNIATAVSMNIDTGSHNCAPVDPPALP